MTKEEEKKAYNKEYYLKNKEKILKRTKEYYEKNKEKIKEYKKESYQKNKKEIKENNNKPEDIVRRKAYDKKRSKIIGLREKVNKRDKQRRKIDKSYHIQCRIKCNFRQAMKRYSTTGKTMPKNKYLDMPAIIKKLTPFPKDRDKYEPDHIIPLSWFNHNDKKEISWAWEPCNLQWLKKEENSRKGNRYIYIKDKRR